MRLDLWKLLSVSLGILVLGSTSPATAADGSKALRYDFEGGKRYVYEIRIESDTPDAKEILSGQSFYTVKLVHADSGNLTLSNYGKLLVDRQKRPEPADADATPSHRPGKVPSGYLRRPRTPAHPVIYPKYETRREITVDPAGNVLKDSGSSQLPFLLGDLWQLVLDPISPEAKLSWRVKTQARIFCSDFHPWRPTLARTDVKSRSAQRTVSYAIEDTVEKTVIIKKKCKLVTGDKVSDEPFLVQSGEGRIEFDRKAGVPRSLEMEFALTIQLDSGQVDIPTKVSARLWDEDKTREYFREQEEAQEATRAAAIEAAKPRVLGDEELNAALADLASNNVFKVQKAGNLLGNAIPTEERREEVASALEPLLRSPRSMVPQAAAKALIVWGTEKNVPGLIAVLEGRSTTRKQSAMKALAALKDPRGAEALARQLMQQRSRINAATALKSMGSVAEEPVLRLLDYDNGIVLSDACQILAVVGGEKSVGPLQKLRDESGNQAIALNAKRALASITLRCDEAGFRKKSGKKKAGRDSEDESLRP